MFDSTQASARSPGARPTIPLVDEVDGRRKSCRRFNELMGAYAKELGGADQLDVVQVAELRNFIAMQMTIERLQRAVARGEPVDGAELGRIVNISERLLARLRRDARPAAA
jgi:hypothetical protein